MKFRLRYASLAESDLVYHRKGQISPDQRQRILNTLTRTVGVAGLLLLALLSFTVNSLLVNRDISGKILSITLFGVIDLLVYRYIFYPSFSPLIHIWRNTPTERRDVILKTAASATAKTLIIDGEPILITDAQFNRIESGQSYRLYIPAGTPYIIGFEPSAESD
ncbi:MAG: hypothetical protein ABI700_05935 [Chloroflexota bacterium]